jgi:hypothetical protein
VLISEEDRPETAFRTPMGHFQCKVLIEGLINALATFQSAMNSIFHPFLRRFVIVYPNNILIYSKSAEEHKVHVKQVWDFCKEAASMSVRPILPLRLRKLSFYDILSSQRNSTHPKKVAAVQEWLCLRTYIILVLFRVWLLTTSGSLLSTLHLWLNL